MLSSAFPWPLNSGASIRVFHCIKQLAKNHEITLLSLLGPEVETLEPVERLCDVLHTASISRKRFQSAVLSLFSAKPYGVVRFHSNQYRDIIKRVLREETFDVVWVHCLSMLEYLHNRDLEDTLTILDQQNADELWWKRYMAEGSIAVRMFGALNLFKVRRYQSRIMKCVDLILSVSPEEAMFTKERVPASCEIWTVPNGVDISFFSPRHRGQRQGNIIMFCGSMNVTMNIDAVMEFCAKIFPEVRNSIPDAKFWIVGKNPPAVIQALSHREGVTVTGTVEDVREYYERATVAVAPFRYGAGTKLKILEAMAMGVPVVSTAVGCQGISVTDGTHLLVADRDAEFASKVIELMRNEETRQRLACEGRALVERKYSWASIMQHAEERLSEYLEPTTRSDEEHVARADIKVPDSSRR